MSLPYPKVVGKGTVRYRCVVCGELIDPADLVWIEADGPAHRKHLPPGGQ